jgi:DNA-binding NarL/FixJ family response regulator
MGGSTEGGAVLVADPDEEGRRQVTRELTAAGFSVLEAASGQEALELARRQPLGLVILEVPLGEISGYEVCRTLREDAGDDVPVMFLSGVRRESYDQVAGFAMGADDYVVKPYSVDELLARVRRLLERRRLAPPPALSRLTPREREVLQLLTDGLSAKEIAERLVISAKTVGTHIEHILTKLDAKSRVQAVTIAFREGLTAAPVPADEGTAGSPVRAVS